MIISILLLLNEMKYGPDNFQKHAKYGGFGHIFKTSILKRSGIPFMIPDHIIIYYPFIHIRYRVIPPNISFLLSLNELKSPLF